MRVLIEGVGLLGPGLTGWRAGREVLAGLQPYHHAPTAIPASELLPAAERRRAGTPVKLALAVGREAFLDSGHDTATTPAVFTSSSGDGEILHRICDTLTTPEREVSPTSFLNSVHNVAAGYWSIATQCREASTSLCAYDASFTAGLLETASQVAVERRPVVLVAYDQPYPEPLRTARAVREKFAVALLLTAHATPRSLAMLELDFRPQATRETAMAQAGLEAVRVSSPAARSLPLLAALAGAGSREIVLPYMEASHLAVKVTPC
jgi:Beta-ketoacyl synthase, N-terminal domain